jgi:hypothetical protein
MLNKPQRCIKPQTVKKIPCKIKEPPQFEAALLLITGITLNRHDIFFFQIGKLVYFDNIGIGQLLHFTFAGFHFIF